MTFHSQPHISLQLCASSCTYVSNHGEGRNIVGQEKLCKCKDGFLEIQREASYLEFPEAYQKVRVCMQIAMVQQPQSLLQRPLLFDRCSSNEERGFTSSAHLQTSANFWISKIFEGDWQIRKDVQETQALPVQQLGACCSIPQNLQ